MNYESDQFRERKGDQGDSCGNDAGGGGADPDGRASVCGEYSEQEAPPVEDAASCDPYRQEAMTVLEAIRRIVDGKRENRQRPELALFSEIYALLPGSWSEMYTEIERLKYEGVIHVGETNKGSYAEIIEK